MLDLHKQYMKAVSDINDILVSADINTRERDPKVANDFLNAISKHLFLINAQYIYDLYETIENDIVFNFHISQLKLNLMMDLLETEIPETQSYFKTKMKSSIVHERETVKTLLLSSKWKKKEPTNELNSIKKIFNFYKDQDVADNNILDLICENIFKTAVQIRDELNKKRRNLIVEIEVDE